MIHPAAHYERLDNGQVVCQLCPLGCKLSDGQPGICRSRFARDGKLFTDNFGELVTLAVDPIEKKPLYHFYPGTRILSTGPNCCNLGCRHCQNWTISQNVTRTKYVSPDQLLAMAISEQSLGVAFTYSEPMVWYEYIMETAPQLRRAGMKVVLVSNGFINPEPLDDFISVSDAMNIDLKSINPAFYRKICKGSLEPVVESIRKIAASNCHLEITNLIIPGQNDSDAEFDELFEFIASLSPYTPTHLSAYHPSYEMTEPPTPTATLERAWKQAKKRLKFVYVGNAWIKDASDTHCPECGLLLVERRGQATRTHGLKSGRCEGCGADAHLVMEKSFKS